MSKTSNTPAAPQAPQDLAVKADPALAAAAQPPGIDGTADAGIGPSEQISGLTADGTELPPVEAPVMVRVLADCLYGKANDLVELPAAALAQAVRDGAVDPDPVAVAYARLLRLQPV